MLPWRRHQSPLRPGCQQLRTFLDCPEVCHQPSGDAITNRLSGLGASSYEPSSTVPKSAISSSGNLISDLLTGFLTISGDSIGIERNLYRVNIDFTQDPAEVPTYLTSEPGDIPGDLYPGGTHVGHMTSVRAPEMSPHPVTG